MKTELIMYHYVRKIKDSTFPGIKGLELEDFEKQILFLRNNYTFVSINEVIEAYSEQKQIPNKSVLLTFDDGYVDHYKNVYPILVKYSIPAVFAIPGKVVAERRVLDVNKIHFILACSDIAVVKTALFDRLNYYRDAWLDIEDNDLLYKKLAKPRGYDDAETMFVKRMLQSYLPEKLRNIITDELFRKIVTKDERDFANELYMSMSQIKEMKSSGMNFAIHGYEHYHFDTLKPETYIPDIRKALDVFEEIIDRNQWIFCYPYGDENDELINFCRKEGCIAGLTCEARSFNLENDSIFRIPRYDTNDYPPRVDYPKSWSEF